MLRCAKKITAGCLAVLCLASVLPQSCFAAEGGKLNLQETVYAEGSYGVYNNKNTENGAEPIYEEITVAAVAYTSKENAELKTGEYCGRANAVMWENGEGSVTWRVNTPRAGLYAVALDYCPIEGKGSAVDLGIKIDGEYPFSEASSVTFPRIWRDNSDKMPMDENGDEYTPEISEVFEWSREYFRDVKGNYGNISYEFYFSAGEHTVTVVCNNETVALESIVLLNKKAVPSYAEIAEKYKAAGCKESKSEIKYIQAETPYRKSDQTLRAQYDRNSPLTQPFDPSHIRYNCIGANAWKYQSQWISWEIDVPEDGLYTLGARYRQETIKGFASSRRLTLDGELPFAEAECIDFAYTEDWDLLLFGQENEPYLFYLTAGKHIMRLEVVMGRVSEIVGSLQNVNDTLVKLYRRIITITGTSPDPYRDYSIAESIPDMVEILEEARRILRTEKKNLETVTGNKSVNTSTIQTLLSQVENVIETPDSLITSARLNSFSSNISSLSSWLLDLKYQPLTIDYFILKAPDDTLPRYNAGFVENFISGFKNFIASFVQQYGISGSSGNEKITIWLSLGRDQLQIINNIVSDSFTPQYKIDVDIKLVDASLIQAILAKNGPDVAIMVARDQPVNLAVRNGLTDLSKLEGFDEVKSRFIDSATVPYEILGGCYGLPDSLSYNMLFYRRDILEEMNVQVPQTWNDLLELAPIMHRNGMKIGLGDVFSALLMQKGVSYYNDSLTDTNFSTPEAYEAFKSWTDYYVLHGFPLSYNFYNLFRTGEMPIGIQSYSMYNTLRVAAPEIDGLWEMAPIPGTEKPDGTIDRTSAASGTACIIFKNTKKTEEAWEFLKWWTSDETQTRYSLETESVLGLSARCSTANIKTMESIPWTKTQLKALKAQLYAIQEVPQVPGDYYVSRNLNNAFNNTVVGGENARASLAKWTEETSIELKRKREEFGLEGLK